MTNKHKFKTSTFVMPADLKQKWLAALRSGEYEQTKRTLFDGTGYCCLGVLEKCVIGEVSRLHIDGEVAGMPSPANERTMGVKFEPDQGGVWGLRANGNYLYLAHLNDSGTSFAKIADLIEKYVEVYDRE
jgi:hypothetical protein